MPARSIIEAIAGTRQKKVDAHQRSQILQYAVAEIGGQPYHRAGPIFVARAIKMCAMVGGQPAAEVERHSENDRGGTFAPAQTIDGEFFDGLEIYIDRRRVPRQR